MICWSLFCLKQVLTDLFCLPVLVCVVHHDIPLLSAYTRQSSSLANVPAERALLYAPTPVSCSHTRQQDHPWWMAAFDGLYRLQGMEATVRVHHTKGESWSECTTSRMSHGRTALYQWLVMVRVHHIKNESWLECITPRVNQGRSCQVDDLPVGAVFLLYTCQPLLPFNLYCHIGIRNIILK